MEHLKVFPTSQWQVTVDLKLIPAGLVYYCLRMIWACPEMHLPKKTLNFLPHIKSGTGSLRSLSAL